ncbi:MAG: site-2 protease family protein [Candidatus Palauibacterales bacterium]|nr:site-2 protease family protein [Candidatus Palauibacterales bacterium]
MRGFRLGRIFGFEISVDLSWLIIVALVVWSFSTAVFPRVVPELSGRAYLVMGVVAGALFFGSLLLHEIAHSLMARAKGVEVEGITLFIFGGVSRMRDEARSARDEFLIAGVGPLASLVIGAAFWALFLLGDALGWSAAAVEVARYLSFLNVALAVFNLLPGFPLDGGRLFRAVLWWWRDDLEEATRIASVGGQAMGVLIATFGLLQLFAGNLIGGLWLGVIGWFLMNAAKMSYRQHVLRAGLEGARARDAMTADPEVVSPNISVGKLVEDHFLRDKHGSYPVVENGEPLGLVTLEETGQVPRDRWDATRVREVMIPFDEQVAVGPDDELFEVIRKLGESPARRVLVVDEGRELLGIVTARDVTTWLALRSGGQAPTPEALPEAVKR